MKITNACDFSVIF